MNRARKSQAEAGFIGSCLGIAAGLTSLIVTFPGAVLVIGVLGYHSLVTIAPYTAVAVAIAGAVTIYVAARKTEGYRAASTIGAVIGFVLFWSVVFTGAYLG